MSWVTGIFIYLTTFSVTLFAVLPWGNRTHENYEDGLAGSAPHNPRIKEKFIATAIISAVIWVIIYILIKLQIIDWRSIAEGMAKEDHLT